MTSQDDDSGRTTPSKTLSAAAKHAQEALDGAKEMVAGADLDQLGAKAADAASTLYREGRELLASNEGLAKAKDHLSESIRKNPLAAVGIAFTAGLLLALLTRG
jgi:ElaB/YqjD/DUF883 family membrane-anchored ribosome-binding protein